MSGGGPPGPVGRPHSGPLPRKRTPCDIRHCALLSLIVLCKQQLAANRSVERGFDTASTLRPREEASPRRLFPPGLRRRFALGQLTCTPTFADKHAGGVRHALDGVRRLGLPMRTVKAGDHLTAGDVRLNVPPTCRWSRQH